MRQLISFIAESKPQIMAELLKNLRYFLMAAIILNPVMLAWKFNDYALMDVSAFVQLTAPYVLINGMAIMFLHGTIRYMVKYGIVLALLLLGVQAKAEATPMYKMATATLWQITNNWDTTYVLLANEYTIEKEVRLIKHVTGQAQLLVSDQGEEAYEPTATTVEFILMEQVSPSGEVISSSAIMRLQDPSGQNVDAAGFYPANCHYTSKSADSWLLWVGRDLIWWIVRKDGWYHVEHMQMNFKFRFKDE